MKLFEDTWTTKNRNYFRIFDTDKNKSFMESTIHKSEYYMEDILGTYKALYDNSINLRRVQGSAYNVDGAYGPVQADYVAIREEYFGKNRYNKTPGIFYLDIETSVSTQPGSVGFPKPEDALEPIVLIQFFDTTSNKGYVLGLEEWSYRDDYSYDFDLEYIKYDTEKELIRGYLDFFKTLDPLIIYAWGGGNFDFPYIINRLKRLGISSNLLSNYGNVKMGSKILKTGQIVNDVKTVGHYYIDMIDVYKKFVFDTVASYSLDFIGEKETGISKVDHSNYLKFDDFRTGKYIITGNETPEHKKTIIHKCAQVLEVATDPAKIAKYNKYIKEKSYSEFVHYGVMDFVILKGIDEARNFTSLMLNIADLFGAKVPDSLGTLKQWNAYISNKALEVDMIMPPKEDHGEPHIVGGFVRDPVKGKHKWILSSDVSSMYPLLSMAAFNMSGETFVPVERRPQEVTDIVNKYFFNQDEDRLFELTSEDWTEIKRVAIKHKVSLGINGAVFHQKFQGIIPKLVLDIYSARKAKKNKMLVIGQEIIDSTNQAEIQKLKHQEVLLYTGQLTDKLSINSLFGSTGNKYFSLFNEHFAAAITGNGRYFIKLLAKNVENKLQKLLPSTGKYVVAGDTDSIYFSINPFIEKYAKEKSISDKTDWSDAFYGKVIEPIVQKTIIQFSKNLNAYAPEHIGADREIIADAALFVAKKKYTARVRDDEGKRLPIDKPYIKVIGLEIQQGGTALFSKKHLKDAIPVILDKTDQEIKDWFQKVREDYNSEDNLYNVAKTIGVSKLTNPDWGKIVNGRRSSPPFGSKTCLASNKYIIENKLEERFPLIEPGAKVKVLHLTKPNPLGNSDAFAFEDGKFAELFRDFIDRDTNFDKFFISPLDNMIKVLNIDVTQNLESLEDEW